MKAPGPIPVRLIGAAFKLIEILCERTGATTEKASVTIVAGGPQITGNPSIRSTWLSTDGLLEGGLRGLQLGEFVGYKGVFLL